MSFYDRLAGQYDRIVAEHDRSEAARTFAEGFESLRFRPQRVLDVACGTGEYALAFARRGCEVVGVDLSERMLSIARDRAEERGLDIRWEQAAMQTLDSRRARQWGRFDAVLCMGNSLPHLASVRELRRTLRGFARRLNPSGAAAVQVLNYPRILQRGERILGVTREGDLEYVRFYDFLPRRVRFNVLQMHWREGKCETRLHQTLLRPWGGEEIEDGFARAGLQRVRHYGGLDLSAFDPERSPTRLTLAEAPQQAR